MSTTVARARPVAPQRSSGVLLAVALVVLLLGTAATATRLDEALVPYLAAQVVVVTAAVVVAHLRVVGVASLGGVTVAVAMLAFWLKWVLDTRPSAPTITSFDNQGAIRVFAAFFLAFALTWVGAVRRGRTPASASPGEEVRRGGVRAGATVLLLVLGAALIVLRLWLASTYRIGVPGETPLARSGGLPVLGAAYYASVYGPLFIATVLLLGRRLGSLTWWLGIALLVAYVQAGITLGYRSYGVTATLVVLYCLYAPSGTTRASGIGRALTTGLALTGAVLATAAALQTRATAAAGGATGFLSSRVGGLEYLSPVVASVDRTGSSWRYLDPSAWNEFVKVGVYNFPPQVTNGLAGTLPGWLYGLSGLLAVVAGGLVAGVIAGRVDRRLAQRDLDLARQVGQLGFLLAWLNLLLEGTVLVTLYIVAATFLVMWLPRVLHPGRAQRPPVRIR